MILCRAVSILVLVLVGVAYLFGLGGAPGYLGGDEAHFAVGGDAIAATGRNLNGDFLPLFFNLADPQGDPQDLAGAPSRKSSTTPTDAPPRRSFAGSAPDA